MLFSPVFIGAEPGTMVAHYAVLPSPSLASGPQVLLLSKLKAPINHAESTLLQVFFLKNVKPFGINTFEKQGEGSPLWLTSCSKKVSARKVGWNPSLPSSVHSSKLCRLQLLRLPLACPERSRRIRKHRGVGPFFPFWLALITAEGFTQRDLCEGNSNDHSPAITNPARGSIPQIEELPHLAELLVARIQQFPERLIRQRQQLPVQHFIQEPRRPFKVRVRAAFRLLHDFVHNAQLFQVLRRDLHGRRRSFRFRRIAPDDRSAPLRRNHRVKAVLQTADAIADCNGQRPARPALPRHRDDYRHRQPRHLAKISRDRFALYAFLRLDPRVCPRRIDKRKNGPPKFRRQLHDAQRFPITLRFGLPEVPH